VAGAFGSFALFKAFEILGVPFLVNALISVQPVCGATAFVFFLVQGKAPSYAWDWVKDLNHLLGH
jgi:hypothetical protein